MMGTDHESSNTVLNFPGLHIKYRAQAHSSVFTDWSDASEAKLHAGGAEQRWQPHAELTRRR